MTDQIIKQNWKIRETGEYDCTYVEAFGILESAKNEIAKQQQEPMEDYP